MVALLDVPAFMRSFKALTKELLLVVEEGWDRVVVETVARACNNHPLNTLLTDCEVFLRQCYGVLKHSKREGNTCADLLVNLGVDQDETFVIFVDPPSLLQLSLGML